jgi:hypothetical protein
MQARTAQEWIEILSNTYKGKMDEPLMLEWLDRHHAEQTLGRVVRKATFEKIVNRTDEWSDPWPASTVLHQTLKEAAE